MRRIETHFVPGPAGPLEALLEEPETGEPHSAALVCHPHPQFGGTMHNKVVYRIARGLRRAGCVVLRFNFRGVNRSAGEHDQGRGEVEDARVCLQWLRDRYPGLPCLLAGFSFGSRVILRLGCAQTGVRQLIAVGFPTQRGDFGFLGECTTPKVFVQSTNDEHGPAADLRQAFERFAHPKQLEWIPAGDHFFQGALEGLEDRVYCLAKP